jgi:hypothetical protein
MFAVLAEEGGAGSVDPARLPGLAEQLRAGLEQGNGPFPVFRSAPRVIRETLLFPYVEGARFVQALWRTMPDSARAAPIGALLPQSTEQVLEPEARFVQARDDPTELRFVGAPAAAAAAVQGGAAEAGSAAGWEPVYENTLGRLETAILLEEHLGIPASSGALGWDGDRYRLLRAAGGQTALEWFSIWDDDSAAQRFASHIDRLLRAARLDATGSVSRELVDDRPVVRVTLMPRTLASPVPRGQVEIVTVPSGAN